MAKIIKPVVISNYRFFESTSVRFFSLFSPIQGSSKKESDFLHYLARPIIDIVMIPVFLFDALVSIVNCVSSILAAAHLWSTSVSKKGLDDKKSSAKSELSEAKTYFLEGVSAITAAIINPVLTIVALVTRLLASIVHLGIDLCRDDQNYKLFK